MSLLVPWAAFPLLMAALSAGCGLLVERIGGRPLPAGLLLPAGAATVMVVSLYPPAVGAPWLANPLVVVLATGGLVFSFPLRIRPRGLLWPAAAALATFGAFAAPVVFSGAATFAGYIKLDDTATYLAMLDHFTSHGYDTSGVPPSTYELTLHTSLAYGYPMGSLTPIGVGRDLLRTDAAWLWQPYLAFLGATTTSGSTARSGAGSTSSSTAATSPPRVTDSTGRVSTSSSRACG